MMPFGSGTGKMVKRHPARKPPLGCINTLEIMGWDGIISIQVCYDTVDGRNPAPPGMYTW